MKSMTTNCLITAAALALTTGIASAQQYRADIPFAFHAGATTLAPGTYSFDIRAERRYIIITNTHTQHSMALMTLASADPSGKVSDQSAALTFVCGANRCSLAQLWVGPWNPALRFSTPRPGQDEPVSATWIRTVKLNGD